MVTQGPGYHAVNEIRPVTKLTLLVDKGLKIFSYLNKTKYYRLRHTQNKLERDLSQKDRPRLPFLEFLIEPMDESYLKFLFHKYLKAITTIPKLVMGGA